MKLDKLQLFTDSTMRLLESTETPIHGSIVPKYSTIWESEQLLKAKSSAFMEVCHQILKHWIKLDFLKEEWRSHTKGLSVISCGQIQKILNVGLYLQEVPVGSLDLK